jgi:hypothetical protein
MRSGGCEALEDCFASSCRRMDSHDRRIAVAMRLVAIWTYVPASFATTGAKASI